MKLHFKYRTVVVPSVEEAQALFVRLRDASGEGVSTFGEGSVYSAGKLVARISYNGRVWDAAGNPVVADDVPGLDADLRHAGFR